jgi:hypothetical protein
VFLTKSTAAGLDTSGGAKAAKKAQAASTVAAIKAQAASAVAAKAQAASAAAAGKAQAASTAAAGKAQAASTAAAGKAQAARASAAESAWQTASAAAGNAATAAQTAAQNAATAATNAAQGAAAAAQSAAANLNTGVRQGVFSARSWAAPKLEDAAAYATGTVAPKVAAALRLTARQVSPEDMTSKSSRKVPLALTWSLLGAAILAGLGAAAALVRYRYQAAITAGRQTPADGTLAEQQVSGKSQVSQPAQQSSPERGAADSPANGRVSSTGW